MAITRGMLTGKGAAKVKSKKGGPFLKKLPSSGTKNSQTRKAQNRKVASESDEEDIDMDTNDAVTKTRTVEVAPAMGSPRNSDYNVGSDAEMGDRAESEDEEELRDDLESEGGGGHVDEGEHEGGSDGGEGSDDDDVEEMLPSVLSKMRINCKRDAVDVLEDARKRRTQKKSRRSTNIGGQSGCHVTPIIAPALDKGKAVPPPRRSSVASAAPPPPPPRRSSAASAAPPPRPAAQTSQSSNRNAQTGVPHPANSAADHSMMGPGTRGPTRSIPELADEESAAEELAENDLTDEEMSNEEARPRRRERRQRIRLHDFTSDEQHVLNLTKYSVQVKIVTEDLFPEPLTAQRWIFAAYKSAIRKLHPDFRTPELSLLTTAKKNFLLGEVISFRGRLAAMVQTEICRLYGLTGEKQAIQDRIKLLIAENDKYRFLKGRDAKTKKWIPYSHPALFLFLQEIIFREDKHNMVLSRFEPGAFTPVPPQTIALVGTLLRYGLLYIMSGGRVEFKVRMYRSKYKACVLNVKCFLNSTSRRLEVFNYYLDRISNTVEGDDSDNEEEGAYMPSSEADMVAGPSS